MAVIDSHFIVAGIDSWPRLLKLLICNPMGAMRPYRQFQGTTEHKSLSSYNKLTNLAQELERTIPFLSLLFPPLEIRNTLQKRQAIK